MTAPTTRAGCVPATAIAPDRIIILNEQEQTLIAQLLGYEANADRRDAARLHDRIAYGDEYDNPVDELARLTLRKRKLEHAVRRENQRIEQLTEQVVEELLEAGHRSVKHDATGATLALDQKIWAKVVREGEKPTDDEKDAAARGLIAAGLGVFVKQGFNTNTVSAYFRELVKEHNEAQQQLPEHERQPRPVESFLPAELEGLIELEDTPTIRVTAPRS